MTAVASGFGRAMASGFSRTIKRPRRQVKRNHGGAGGQHEHRGAPLDPQRWQEQEPRDQGAGDGAGGVGEVERASTPADGALGVLDDRVAEGKGDPHQQRRNAHLEQHRSRVEPQLLDGASERGHLAPGGGERGRVRQSDVPDRFRIRGRQSEKRGGDEQALRDDQPLRRLIRAAEDDPAGERAHRDPEEDEGQQQREHGAEFTEEDAEMAEPDDLHAHRGEPRQGERQRDQRDS